MNVYSVIFSKNKKQTPVTAFMYGIFMNECWKDEGGVEEEEKKKKKKTQQMDQTV